MSLRKTALLSACALTVFILAFLRLLNILGSEYDLLMRWVSAISLLLIGIIIGMSISEKKIQVRGMLAILLFLAGFCAALLVIWYFTWDFGIGLRRRALSSSET